MTARRAARLATGRILRAPVTGRTWAELAYVLVGVPLGVAGALAAVTLLGLGALLAVTAAGIPLVAAVPRGARGLGAAYRWLAARLVGERLAAPRPPRPSRGFYGWVQAGLGDAAGWRALVYVLVKLPVAALGSGVVLLFWAFGLVSLTAPLQLLLGQNLTTVRDASGAVREGLSPFGLVLIDTLPPTLPLSAIGLVLLLAAPWAVRGVVVVDRLVLRNLLGPGPSERIRALEETRAHAVADAAATLRRIERDLHDGAQARLVALAMTLTMLKDSLGADTPGTPDLAQVRALADRAHQGAKEAIAELRDIVQGIHPPVLDKGLDVALATLAARSAVPVQVDTDIPERPAAAVETIAYFCAAELLTNIARHSRARHATIQVRQPGGRLLLRVTDDGVGGAQPVGGSGLAGLTDRARTIDGRLDITSPPGGPTVVTVELPSQP